MRWCRLVLSLVVTAYARAIGHHAGRASRYCLGSYCRTGDQSKSNQPNPSSEHIAASQTLIELAVCQREVIVLIEDILTIMISPSRTTKSECALVNFLIRTIRIIEFGVAGYMPNNKLRIGRRRRCDTRPLPFLLQQRSKVLDLHCDQYVQRPSQRTRWRRRLQSYNLPPFVAAVSRRRFFCPPLRGQIGGYTDGSRTCFWYVDRNGSPHIQPAGRCLVLL